MFKKKKRETKKMVKKPLKRKVRIGTIITFFAIIGFLLFIGLGLYVFWWVSRLEVPSIEGFETRQV